MPLTYTIGSLTEQYTPSWIEKRAQICFSFFIIMMASLCIGPSELLSFPNSLILMGFGHAIGGFFLAQAGQPALIEMINVGKARYPEWEELTSAMSAAAYNSMMGISYLVAPIYGTGVEKVIGFRMTMDSLALIDLIFLILYLTVGKGYSGFGQMFRNL